MNGVRIAGTTKDIDNFCPEVFNQPDSFVMPSASGEAGAREFMQRDSGYDDDVPKMDYSQMLWS